MAGRRRVRDGRRLRPRLPGQPRRRPPVAPPDPAQAQAPQPPNEECFHCRIIHDIALKIKLDNTNPIHLDVIAIPELERIVPEYDEHGDARARMPARR